MGTISITQPTSNRLKRKRAADDDDPPNKRKFMTNIDDDERLTLSPRISPVISKVNKSFLSTALFRCQLCRRYLNTKDHYMNHMIICSIERQASIKIVRSLKDKDEC